MREIFVTRPVDAHARMCASEGAKRPSGGGCGRGRGRGIFEKQIMKKAFSEQ